MIDGRELLAKITYATKMRLRHPKALKAYQLLEEEQWLPPSEMRELQWQRLNELICYAYQACPYYLRVFDAKGIDPNGIRDSEFQFIPILTKEIIQKEHHNIRSTTISTSHFMENHTGGSTGEPLTFYQCGDYESYKTAGLRLVFEYCGWQPGDSQLFIWGSDYDAKSHETLRGRISDFVQNIHMINAFNLSEQVLTHHLDKMARWQPKYIWGYVSAIETFAKFLESKKSVELKPLAIQTTAEVLTATQREFIKEIFGCQLFDRYGCREVSIIAHECSEHRGLHVFESNNFVEILREDGSPVSPGEIGRIVVTNLHNRAMPFIRYDTGDLGTWAQEECTCGRSWRLIKEIKGRQTDIIVSPSGKLIHGEFFTHLFYKLKGIKQFQVLQEDVKRLIIKLVKEYDFSEDTLEFLRNVIHTHADAAFEIDFEYCKKIEASPSGKFRFTISNVKWTF